MPRHPLYPNRYLWFVLLSSLDVFFTWIVLFHGGREANPLAASVMGLHPKALVYYKFAIVVFFICQCEAVGSRNRRTGRLLVTAGCVLTCVPVALATVQLLLQ